MGINNILLIAPNVGGFYKDVINELNRRGYNVDYIWDRIYSEDPDFIHSPYYNQVEKYKDSFLAKLKAEWEIILSKPEYNKVYDLLFVIDGKMIHPYLFETLKQRNPNVRSINYLFDTVRGNYRFNINFYLFDKVVTYDQQDSRMFGIDLMPIPWTQSEKTSSVNLSFFALGTYDSSRFEIFSFIDRLSKKNHLSSYIKLYFRRKKLYLLQYFISVIRHRSFIKPCIYYNKLIVHDFMSKEEFTKKMMESEVIVDSINPSQDGLTARFTWALGAEKKIITNNKSVKTYDFFTPEQVYIIEDLSHRTEKEVLDFLNKKYVMTPDIRQKIATFRMDNWIDNLLFTH